MWGWQSPSSRRVVESRRAPSPRRCSGQTRGGLGGVRGGDRAGTGSQGSPGKAATPRIGHWGRDGREGGDLGRPTNKDALHRKGEGTGDEGEGRSSWNGAGVRIQTAKKFVALARKAGTLFILKWAALPEPVGASTRRANQPGLPHLTRPRHGGGKTRFIVTINSVCDRCTSLKKVGLARRRAASAAL